jgi:hypothetical protein
VVKEDDRTAFLGNVLVSFQYTAKKHGRPRPTALPRGNDGLEPTTEWRLPLGPGLWLLGAANGHTAVYEALG